MAKKQKALTDESNWSDETKAMAAITAENQKLPAVDHNGQPIDGAPAVWTFDAAGNPVKVVQPPGDNSGA